MLGLFFILVLMFATLTVLLWAGSYFFQGYIYTEPSPGMFWQAPAAGFLLTIGFAIWALAIAMGDRSSPTNRPIDTLMRFSPRDEMLDRPAPLIWAVKADRRKPGEFKDGESTLYESKREGPNRFQYKDKTTNPRPWQPQDIVALDVEKNDGTKWRFNYVPGGEGAYGYFVSQDGWVIEVDKYNAPTGIPVKFFYGRLIWNLAFNFGHLFGWFIALWVVLRFQWPHALGFALVLWVLFTLIFLPMLLGYAGEVAVSRQTRAALVYFFLPLAA